VKLKRKRSVPKTVERAVRKRIDSALEVIDGNPPTRMTDAGVHDARRQLKRSRGVMRLVKDELGGKRFARTNRRLRDASRPLSDLRDAKVLIDTLDDLCNKDGIPSGLCTKIRLALEGRRRRVRERILKDRGTRQTMGKMLRKASRSIARGSPTHRGWKSIAGGLSRTYRYGRAAMESAIRDGSDDALHESRKRTKDLLYAAEFIVRARPQSIQPIIDQAHALTNLLGDDHDLTVLQTVIDKELDLRLSSVRRNQIKRLIAQRRKDMQRQAQDLGQRLYAQSEDAFVARIHGYWKAWRRTRRTR
jgi:CHAD domain-containing protein